MYGSLSHIIGTYLVDSDRALEQHLNVTTTDELILHTLYYIIYSYSILCYRQQSIPDMLSSLNNKLLPEYVFTFDQI